MFFIVYTEWLSYCQNCKTKCARALSAPTRPPAASILPCRDLFLRKRPPSNRVQSHHLQSNPKYPSPRFKEGHIMPLLIFAAANGSSRTVDKVLACACEPSVRLCAFSIGRAQSGLSLFRRVTLLCFPGCPSV